MQERALLNSYQCGDLIQLPKVLQSLWLKVPYGDRNHVFL
jgi:hypothetical protein